MQRCKHRNFKLVGMYFICQDCGIETPINFINSKTILAAMLGMSRAGLHNWMIREHIRFPMDYAYFKKISENRVNVIDRDKYIRKLDMLKDLGISTYKFYQMVSALNIEFDTSCAYYSHIMTKERYQELRPQMVKYINRKITDKKMFLKDAAEQLKTSISELKKILKMLNIKVYKPQNNSVCYITLVKWELNKSVIEKILEVYNNAGQIKTTNGSTAPIGNS